jgi:hypothetical protein
MAPLAQRVAARTPNTAEGPWITIGIDGASTFLEADDRVVELPVAQATAGCNNPDRDSTQCVVSGNRAIAAVVAKAIAADAHLALPDDRELAYGVTWSTWRSYVVARAPITGMLDVDGKHVSIYDDRPIIRVTFSAAGRAQLAALAGRTVAMITDGIVMATGIVEPGPDADIAIAPDGPDGERQLMHGNNLLSILRSGVRCPMHRV